MARKYINQECDLSTLEQENFYNQEYSFATLGKFYGKITPSVLYFNIKYNTAEGMVEYFNSTSKERAVKNVPRN